MGGFRAPIGFDYDSHGKGSVSFDCDSSWGMAGLASSRARPRKPHRPWPVHGAGLEFGTDGLSPGARSSGETVSPPEFRFGTLGTVLGLGPFGWYITIFCKPGCFEFFTP